MIAVLLWLWCTARAVSAWAGFQWRLWRMFRRLWPCLGDRAPEVARLAGRAAIRRRLAPAEYDDLLELATREVEAAGAGADLEQVRQSVEQTAELWAIIRQEQQRTEVAHGCVEVED